MYNHITNGRLTRRLMAKILTRLGHHVVTAKHGKEGLDVIDAAYHLKPDCPSVDIVFLDKYVIRRPFT
jgi:CheY-like chemotaxis protein